MRFFVALLFCLLTAAPSAGQDTYRTPAPELAALVDAPLTPSVYFSPSGTTMAVCPRQALPTIDDLASGEVRLAGRRINPAIYGPSRGSYLIGLSLRDVDTGEERAVAGLPDNPRISSVSWSADGQWLAFSNTSDSGIHAWLVEVSSATARQLSSRRLNATLDTSPVAWMPDSEHLVVLALPAYHGPTPERPKAPAAPVVQETGEHAAPARTYQDLLKDSFEEELFTHLTTSQIVLVGVDGSERELGQPGVINRASPSPDGSYLLQHTVQKPYSYLVPYYRFPSVYAAVDVETGERTVIAEVALAEDVPTGFDSVPVGARSVNWRQDKASTLVWVEAADGGDQSVDAVIRDVVFEWASPFTGDPGRFAELSYRYNGIDWADNGRALLWEGWWTDRMRRISIVNSETGAIVRVLFEGSTEDRYADPGYAMTVDGPGGTDLLATTADGENFFMSGTGASPEGDRPFVHRHAFAGGEPDEVFRSSEPYYEIPRGFLGGDSERLLVTRESPDMPPNYVLVDLSSGDERVITEFPHPYPQLAGITKEKLVYQRADGVTLTADLYLPAGYDAERDGPLPTFLWAYPREFKSAANAAQVTGSKYRFKSMSYWGALPYVTRGYAILNNAAIPIIGEGDTEPNDTFVEQLVSSAKAAIDEGVRRGVVDAERVGVGGHSYGAFMTGNLLAHSDLFRAGIARSGAYNRSLTPFGFQREARTFWEAPEVYFRMSPFMNADKVNEPLLLIHGAADNNSGTFPIQSERFYHAVKGLGGTARLVMLPNESHGYRARESLLHMLWEMDSWLERFVKNAPDRSVEVKDATGK